MPHINIECPANPEPDLDMGALCETIRACAAGINTFPMVRIGDRVRFRSVPLHPYQL